MNIFNQIRSGFQQGFGKGGQLDPNRIFNQIQSGVKQVADQAENGINQVANQAKNEINQIGADVKKASYAVQGEVASNVNRVANDAKNLVETAKNEAGVFITTAKNELATIKQEITTDEAKIHTFLHDHFEGDIKDIAHKFFHELEDELKHLVIQAGVKNLLSDLKKAADYGSGFLPENVNVDMAIIAMSFSGLGTLDDDGKTGIEKLIKHASDYQQLSWSGNDVEKFYSWVCRLRR